MIPLVDMHCHLLAGLDDGPRTEDEALAMCRIAYEDGVRLAAATAHQNERWAAVTPERIRRAARQLGQRLHDAGLAFTVFPSAEVMVRPVMAPAWNAGEILSVADRGQYLLIEQPNGFFVDPRGLVRELCQAGARPILAHPERHEELLHDPGRVEALIADGCLVQVSSGSVTAPASRQDEQALKSWFKRGVVHLIGSDGHSRTRRPPKVADAYRRVRAWAGSAAADRVCSTNGMAVLQGLTLRVPAPEARRVRWFARLW